MMDWNRLLWKISSQTILENSWLSFLYRNTFGEIVETMIAYEKSFETYAKEFGALHEKGYFISGAYPGHESYSSGHPSSFAFADSHLLEPTESSFVAHSSMDYAVSDFTTPHLQPQNIAEVTGQVMYSPLMSSVGQAIHSDWMTEDHYDMAGCAYAECSALHEQEEELVVFDQAHYSLWELFSLHHSLDIISMTQDMLTLSQGFADQLSSMLFTEVEEKLREEFGEESEDFEEMLQAITYAIQCAFAHAVPITPEEEQLLFDMWCYPDLPNYHGHFSERLASLGGT